MSDTVLKRNWRKVTKCFWQQRLEPVQRILRLLELTLAL